MRCSAMRALQLIDPLVTRILQEQRMTVYALHTLARHLILLATDREPLKIAIALFGLVARPEDEELILTVGSHDEFTLFAGVALIQSQPDPVPTLWKLARRVRGWGRIHLLERLAQFEELPDELREWMLTDGYRNDVMIEYTALLCAQEGRLHATLSREHVDDAILDGSGEILSALLTDSGPAATIEDYPDAPAVLTAF